MAERRVKEKGRDITKATRAVETAEAKRVSKRNKAQMKGPQPGPRAHPSREESLLVLSSKNRQNDKKVDLKKNLEKDATRGGGLEGRTDRQSSFPEDLAFKS